MTLDAIDNNKYSEWRSILTLSVVLATNIIIPFRIRIPFYVPNILLHPLRAQIQYWLSWPNKVRATQLDHNLVRSGDDSHQKRFTRFFIPVNVTTAPPAAVLLLLATTAMTSQELRRGILGYDNITPLDIVAFALTIGYISGSINASGLLKYGTARILRSDGSSSKGGKRLFVLFYAFFFITGAVFGNDPMIQWGMLILANLYKATSNIQHPRAWLFMQYAVINIASAIFVSSGTTNVVIASAFNIGFAEYTRNVALPAIVTALLLLPYLLFFVFAAPHFIPEMIKLRRLSTHAILRPPVNPIISSYNAKSLRSKSKKSDEDAEEDLDSASEAVLNPFLDKGGALVGGVLMILTLVLLFAISVVTLDKNNVPVYWVTLPAAVVLFIYDVTSSWTWRQNIRAMMRRKSETNLEGNTNVATTNSDPSKDPPTPLSHSFSHNDSVPETARNQTDVSTEANPVSRSADNCSTQQAEAWLPPEGHQLRRAVPLSQMEVIEPFIVAAKTWLQESFLTATSVLIQLPFSVIPFALSTFVLVQALVDKGWVAVFARGWTNWVYRTGIVGAIGGMGFWSVILSNVAGTNIGAAIFLCRALQQWQEWQQQEQMLSTPAITTLDPEAMSKALKGATFALALGANYGTFSTSFGASLAGISWGEDLAREKIRIGGFQFALTNVPIIALAMAVGCSVLVGQIYLFK